MELHEVHQLTQSYACTPQSKLQRIHAMLRQAEVGADPHMVVDKATPVQQVHHSLEAEHGLAAQLSIFGNHA